MKFTGKATYIPPVTYMGYDRESKYLYAPLGFDLSKEINKKWQVDFNLEYDFLLRGEQTSYLEDTGILTYAPDAGKWYLFDPLVNDQKKDMG